MKYESITRKMFVLAAVGLLPAAIAGGQTKGLTEMEREGIQLIRQLEEVGRDVRYNAGRLNSLTGNILISRWTHVHHLEQIKSLVNEGLRPALERLVEIQAQLPAWKQQSVDVMLESARRLAADIDSATLVKKETANVPPALNAEYKALVARVYQHAETLVRTSDAAGAYASARAKADLAGLKIPQK